MLQKCHISGLQQVYQKCWQVILDFQADLCSPNTMTAARWLIFGNLACITSNGVIRAYLHESIQRYIRNTDD